MDDNVLARTYSCKGLPRLCIRAAQMEVWGVKIRFAPRKSRDLQLGRQILAPHTQRSRYSKHASTTRSLNP